MAADIVAVLDALDIAHADVMGYSMGGYLAIRLMQRCARRACAASILAGRRRELLHGFARIGPRSSRKACSRPIPRRSSIRRRSRSAPSASARATISSPWPPASGDRDTLVRAGRASAAIPTRCWSCAASRTIRPVRPSRSAARFHNGRARHRAAPQPSLDGRRSRLSRIRRSNSSTGLGLLPMAESQFDWADPLPLEPASHRRRTHGARVRAPLLRREARAARARRFSP